MPKSVSVVTEHVDGRTTTHIVHPFNSERMVLEALFALLENEEILEFRVKTVWTKEEVDLLPGATFVEF